MIDQGAIFSTDRKHRHYLWRIWDDENPMVMFIGLNPSTANESENDPTIKSVIRISKANGYGGVYMMNCWSYIATKPENLIIHPEETAGNDDLLKTIGKRCLNIVFAWGNFKIVRDTGRDKELLEMFPRALALHINKNGTPKHPLYCKSDTKLISYNS